MSAMVCDKRMQIKPKVQYTYRPYKTIITSIIMYGSETWALRKAEQLRHVRKNRDDNVEMDDGNMNENIRTEETRAMTDVAIISDQFR